MGRRGDTEIARLPDRRARDHVFSVSRYHAITVSLEF